MRHTLTLTHTRTNECFWKGTCCRYYRQYRQEPRRLRYRYVRNLYALLFFFAVILAHANTVLTSSTPKRARLLRSTKSVSGTQGASIALMAGPENKLSIETNSLPLSTDSNLSESNGAVDHNRSLKRVFLSNRTITCNDGSQAGFYLRKNGHSKKWIVFLEGGWHCYDTRSCRARWLRLRHLMTSAQWPETRDVGGILSSLPEENPYWHNANHVLVPYCSSDSWSGTRMTGTGTTESRDNNWRFMGALILRQVIVDLIPLGLGRISGAELLLVGSSAGGLGVMLNLDQITQFLLHERNLLVTVRGVSDSGWFLDREPYTPSAVASSEAVRQGWKLWQGLLPEECTRQHTNEPWRCYFGYRLYPTLKAPLFVFQWLFDEAQMRADNVGAPVTPQQWNYIHEMGGALRSSLDNVTAVFAPSCIGHAVVSKRDWVHIKIDDISLPSALRCWEHSTRPRRKRHNKLKCSTEATLSADDNTYTVNETKRKQRHKTNNNINNINNINNRQRHRNSHRNTVLATVENYKHDNGVEYEHANLNMNISKNHVQAKHNHESQRLGKEKLEERKRRRQEQRQRRRQERRRQRKNSSNQINKEKNNNYNNENKNNNNIKNVNMTTIAKNNNNEKSTEGFTKKKSKHRRQNVNSPIMDTNGRRKALIQGRKQKRQEQYQQHVRDEQADALFLQNDQQSASGGELTATQDRHLLSHSGYSSTIYSFSPSPANNGNRGRGNRIPRVPDKCVLRLLERCSWPQCNHSCPTLTNPLTGEEMRFLELLTSFGLDIEAVAAALGVDMHTLNNMDRTELVNLLTQQVS